MWGQGLATANKFATRAADSLARERGRTPILKLTAHSGAVIKSTRAAREKFVVTFPHLFANTSQRSAFIGPETPDAGFQHDESPADLENLSGEIPRAFPTVHHQLRSIPEADAGRVDVLFLDGGANDLDFQTVLTTKDFASKLDSKFEKTFYEDVLELIAAARQKCPKAQIVYTGYYSAFSPESQFGAMKDLFLTLKKKKSEYKVFHALDFALVGLLNGILGFEDDIEDAVALARATSEYGESRGNYWIRRAVSEINEKPTLVAVRGPGVTFAAPGFRPEHCTFAREPLIWQKFETDELDDDVSVARARACPRSRLRDEMDDLKRHVIFSEPVLISVEKLTVFHNELDGPEDLRDALLALASDVLSATKRERVIDLLTSEIDRIDVTRIASLLHPNRGGAVRYASVVHKRAQQLQEVSVQNRLHAFLTPGERKTPPAMMSVGRTFRRFGFEPAVGLRACAAHAEPDVISLIVRTHPSSDVFSQDAFLDLGDAGRLRLRHLLNVDLSGDMELNPHFQPGDRDFFTIDVAGQIKIGDITRAVIEFEGTSDARWRPEDFELSIDGSVVAKRQVLDVARPDVRRLDLGYPD